MQVRKSERNVFAQYGPDKLPAFLQIVPPETIFKSCRYFLS